MKRVDWWLVLAISAGIVATVAFAMTHKPQVTPCPTRIVRRQPMIIGKLITTMPVYECIPKRKADSTKTHTDNELHP
jgi:hypothetical protein